MKKAIVLQGVPGSGKSTYARSLRNLIPDDNYNGFLICSTDDGFGTTPEEYKKNFDPSKLGILHAQNLHKYIEACRNEYSLVVCDNTNTTVAELAPYVAAAEAYGYEVEIHYINCDPEVAIKRNVHGVPAKAIWAMNERIQSCVLPPWWTRKKIECIVPGEYAILA